MQNVDSLTQFLTLANTQFQLFDMGHQVRPLPVELFTRCETQELPYPWPVQQQAWLGVHFHHEEGKHYLWFLTFPLDERGLLMPAGPKQFIEQVVEILGQQLTVELDEKSANQLAQNQFIFRPDEPKMAAVHAKLSRQLGHPPSPFYEPLRQYLAHPIPDEWQNLGLQGFADLAERVGEEENLRLVCKAIGKLPQPPLHALCQALESVALPATLQGALLERINQELELAHPDNENIAWLCRAQASCPPQAKRQKKLLTLLAMHNSPSLLLAIAGRLSDDLVEPEILTLFLERLAEQPTPFFNQLFAELVTQPSLRPLMLARLRDPSRSTRLGQAIGNLFEAARNT